MDKAEELNNTLLRALECPLCLESMCSQIYLCAGGHSICQICWVKVDKCPTCEKNLTETRNYTLEAASQLLLHNCDNKEYGCNEVFTIAELTEHLKVCRFREYSCRVTTRNRCNFVGRLNDLKAHIYEHPRHVVEWNPCSFVWTPNWLTDFTYVMVCFGQMFYVHRCIRKDQMYWSCQYLGNPDNAAQYNFVVYLRSGAPERRYISIMERCQPDSIENVDVLMESGNNAVISLTTLKKFQTDEYEVRYAIHIKQEVNNY